MLREITILALLAGLSVPAESAGAPADRQAESSQPSSADVPPTLTDRVDERYRIGAGDIVDVRVFDHPELSRSAVRVDGTGVVRMPLLDKDIVAACKTESELALEIQSRYRELLVNPNVDVFIVTFSSQPVAVTGAVLKPGSFQLERRVRLRELLTLAGGPTEQAGQLVQIVRDEYSPVCLGDRIGHEPVEIVAGGEVVDAPIEPAGMVTIELDSLMRGQPGSNPYVRPGDLVNVPQARQVYVVGNVHNPTTLLLKEPLTLSRAIAMAGGALPNSQRGKIRILRREPGAPTNVQIVVSLNGIEKSEANDPYLQPDDIVTVPLSTGKLVLRSMLMTVAQTAVWAPLVIIQ